MKEFVKMVLAVLCGFFILWILGLLLMLGMAGSAALSGGSKTVLPREGVLDINYDEFSLVEQVQEVAMPSVMSLYSGETTASVGIWDAVRAIRTAAADPGVKYILLRGDTTPGGISSLEEFRAALSAFRESGKPIIAYTENADNGNYYLNSVADKIYMLADHGGMSRLIGLSGNMLFLKDLMDKLGINYQLIRHGKYKSAGEMYTKSAPSPENLEQNRVMVESMWKVISAEMAKAREMDVATLNGLIDDLKLNFPEDFRDAGLVDSLVTHEVLVQRLCDLAVVESKDDLHLIPFADYVTAKTPVQSAKICNAVAVLYADGEILDGDDVSGITGDRYVRIIDRIRKDDKVKSVVLRVNSPGGSVVASTKIKNALDLLMAEKPVVASYGNYAASGGYWISNGCEKIFTDATTLTGSIGVFGLIPEFSKAAKDVAHVNLVSVGSNRHSDMFSLMRPFDAAEMAYLQANIEDTYTTFVNMVAEGRDMTPEAVDEIAQGRVWTGTDALGIGLVDEIGTLQDAVNYAAEQAGYISESDYTVVAYPRPLTAMEQFYEMIGQSRRDKSILAGTPFEGVGKALQALKDREPFAVWASLPYSIEIQ